MWNTLHKLLEFIYAPVVYPKILYIMLPAVFTIGIMDMYFKRYPRENLGNHKSMETSIFMLFIAFNLLGYLLTASAYPAKIAVTILFGIVTLLVLYLDFFHKLPIKSYWNLSVKALLLLYSYFAVTLVYGEMLASGDLLNLLETAVAMLLGVLIFVFISSVFRALEPKSYADIEKFLDRIEHDIKKVDDDVRADVSAAKIKDPEPIAAPKKVVSKKRKR